MLAPFVLLRCLWHIRRQHWLLSLRFQSIFERKGIDLLSLELHAVLFTLVARLSTLAYQLDFKLARRLFILVIVWEFPDMQRGVRRCARPVSGQSRRLDCDLERVGVSFRIIEARGADALDRGDVVVVRDPVHA